MVELSLVIPCYNEEKNIEKVASGIMRELDSTGITYELILVNNGSTDGTDEVISRITGRNERVKSVTVPINQGYGHGVLAGMGSARGDYIGFSDGDDQIPMDAVTRLFRKVKEENAQVGKTFRVKRGDGILRKGLSWCYGTLLSVVFFADMSDANCKPKILRRDFYEKASLQSQDFFLDTELLLKAKKTGCKICSVPIEFKKRWSGSSSIGIAAVLEFFRNIIKYKFGKI